MQFIFLVLTMCSLMFAENQYTLNTIKLKDNIFVDSDNKPITGVLIRITKYPEAGLKVINRYKNGSLNGLSEMYYDNGTLKSRMNYENGLVVGEAQLYDKTGKLRVIDNYKNDKKNGISKIFNDHSTYYITYVNDFPINGYFITTNSNSIKIVLTQKDLENFY